ncbi:MAG: M35 family metallo-endopeptidase [Alphaproteobacteria bacterium]
MVRHAVLACALGSAMAFAGAGARADTPHVALDFEPKCTDLQTQQIAEAMMMAYLSIEVVVSDLGSHPPSKFAERAIDIWFGADVETPQVLRMYRRIFKRIQDGEKPIAITCDHHEDLYGWTWMETDDRANIGFGRAFFQARVIGGYDTRMGTIVHELSHMVREVASDDIVYGIAGAQDLARQGEEHPIHNADSFEYLVEMMVGNRKNQLPRQSAEHPAL